MKSRDFYKKQIHLSGEELQRAQTLYNDIKRAFHHFFYFYFLNLILRYHEISFLFKKKKCLYRMSYYKMDYHSMTLLNRGHLPLLYSVWILDTIVLLF